MEAMRTIADRISNSVHSMILLTLKRQKSGQMCVFEKELLQLAESRPTNPFFYRKVRSFEHAEAESGLLFCFVTYFARINENDTYDRISKSCLSHMFSRLNRHTQRQLLLVCIDNNDLELTLFILTQMNAQTKVEKLLLLHYVVERQPTMLDDIFQHSDLNLCHALANIVDNQYGMSIFNYTCAVSDNENVVPLIRILYKNQVHCTKYLTCSQKKVVKEYDLWGRNTWLILMQNMQLNSLTILKVFKQIEQEEHLTPLEYIDLDVASCRDTNGHNLTYYLCKRCDMDVKLFDFCACRNMLKCTRDPINRLDADVAGHHTGHWCNFNELDLLIKYTTQDEAEKNADTLKFKMDTLLTISNTDILPRVINEIYIHLPPKFLMFLINEKGFIINPKPEVNGLSLFTHMLIQSLPENDPNNVANLRKRQILAKYKGIRSNESELSLQWWYCHPEVVTRPDQLRWMVAYEGGGLEWIHWRCVHSLNEESKMMSDWVKMLQSPRREHDLSHICMRQIHHILKMNNNTNLIWCVSQLELPWVLKRFLCFDLDLDFLKEGRLKC